VNRTRGMQLPPRVAAMMTSGALEREREREFTTELHLQQGALECNYSNSFYSSKTQHVPVRGLRTDFMDACYGKP
jgi:hypothetical protein